MSDDPTRKGLGRGLSALLEESPDDQAALDRLRGSRSVPIENLVPNRYQPRTVFDTEELQALAASIRENGILVPILVRRLADEPERYEIVADERRWRAAQTAQQHDVPVVIKELSDGEALEVALVENIQRQDLTAIEEAEGYQRLMDEFRHTQEDLARVVGKSRSHVANTLRLLGLPEAVKGMVQQGQLTAGHARALLTMAMPEELAAKVVRQGLNVRQTERLAKKPAGEAGKTPPVKDADTRAIEKQLSERLGLKVTINHRGEKGEVRIGFSTLEQFDDILRRLRQTPHPD